MSDFNCNSSGFKEAVCIEADRIYDSCSDKDCLEDLEIVFTDDSANQIIENASFIKSKSVEVTNIFFAIEQLPFNKGFYSIDLTYTFNVILEAFSKANSLGTTVSGTCSFAKKVILYGSEGNAKVFSSEDCGDMLNNCITVTSLPKATVSVVEPIILDSRLVTKYPFPCGDEHENCCGCENVPSVQHGCRKKVYITIGLFSIVKLQRPVPILIPAYDYCIPTKECSSASTDSACELFEKIKFPTNEFIPPSLEDVEGNCNN